MGKTPNTHAANLSLHSANRQTLGWMVELWLLTSEIIWICALWNWRFSVSFTCCVYSYCVKPCLHCHCLCNWIAELRSIFKIAAEHCMRYDLAVFVLSSVHFLKIYFQCVEIVDTLNKPREEENWVSKRPYNVIIYFNEFRVENVPVAF